MSTEDLYKAVTTIAPLVLTPENAHMKKVWEMILGGLILPEMVKEDPSVLQANEAYQKMLDEHSKEKIEAFLHPKPVELTKEVRVEVPVKVPVEVPGAPGKNGKFRRLKEKVEKKSRKSRSLTSNDRDRIIARWNVEQRLVPKEDPICAHVAKVINENSGLDPIAPLQVAGYFSHLCRMGRNSDTIREDRIKRALERGDYTIKPHYSKELINKIIENWQKERHDEEVRRKDHAELRKRRASGDTTPIKTVIPGEESALQTPVQHEAPEEFDIGKISFS